MALSLHFIITIPFSFPFLLLFVSVSHCLCRCSLIVLLFCTMCSRKCIFGNTYSFSLAVCVHNFAGHIPNGLLSIELSIQLPLRFQILITVFLWSRHQQTANYIFTRNIFELWKYSDIVTKWHSSRTTHTHNSSRRFHSTIIFLVSFNFFLRPNQTHAHKHTHKRLQYELDVKLWNVFKYRIVPVQMLCSNLKRNFSRLLCLWFMKRKFRGRKEFDRSHALIFTISFTSHYTRTHTMLFDCFNLNRSQFTAKTKVIKINLNVSFGICF